jgi:hypothetical protein
MECEKNSPYDFDPNGGVGTYQFLQSVNIVVQAWDKSTGNGIFVSNKGGTTASVQGVTSPFQPKLATHCAHVGGDDLAMYDHMDGVWIIAFKTTWKDGNNFTHYSFCIATSTQDDLEGTGGASYWNAYDFVLDTVLPTDSNDSQNYYHPDYSKLGTWNDGHFYVSWDLFDPVKFTVYGSEVCSLDRTSIVAGNAASPMNCYVYWPAGQTNGMWNAGTKPTLIHTILPADVESSNPVQQPPSGRSPWFLAIVNPNNGNGGPCNSGPCTSNQLALWNWTAVSGQQAPNLLTVNTYTPGCYDPGNPVATICIPEPGGYKVDSVGDRMMHRLVYRNLPQNSTLSRLGGETLAATHTINDPSSGNTDIRYYLIRVSGDSTPSVAATGNLSDATLNLFMPSASMDEKGDLGIVYSTSAGCTTSNCYPALNFVVVPNGQAPDPPTLVIQGTAENQATPGLWGDYFGAGVDPTDDLTFWGVGEYFNTTQTNSLVTWQTRITKCQYTNGC